MAKKPAVKKPANRFSEDELTSFRCSDGAHRKIHIWGPAKPKGVFLAVHGGLAHAGDWVTPALHFKKKGWATASFDMHGHTGQARVDIPSFNIFLDDMQLFLQWVKARYPKKPIVFLTHSMGALIIAHFALQRLPHGDPQIKGYIMSSPYFGNAVKVPKILVALSKPMAALLPKMKVPAPSLTGSLTHDDEITRRHYADEKDLIRATESSLRFGNALLSAHAELAEIIHKWNQPVFMIVAGDDHLADIKVAEASAAKIDPKLLRYDFYPENYHENFNELNRGKIFKDIESWLKKTLKLS
jgi:lysophospholipase